MDTKTSLDLAKIGQLASFTLKNGVNRSIIRTNMTFSVIGGYSTFTSLEKTNFQHNPTNLVMEFLINLGNLLVASHIKDTGNNLR